MIYVILLFISSFSHSKDNNQLGVGFSNLSGAGASYNYKFNSLIHIELNSFYFYLGDKPPLVYDTYFNFGGEIQLNLLRYSEFDNRLYFLIGTSYWNVNKHYSKDITSINGSPDQENVVDNYKLFNYGVGVGNQFIFKENYSLNFSILYQLQNSDVSPLNNLIDRNPKSNSFNGLGFGISLKYRW